AAARAIAGLHADLPGEGVERLLRAAAGDEAGEPQVVPEHARLRRSGRRLSGAGRAGGVIGAPDDAVAVAGTPVRPARRVGIVARNGAIAVLVAVIGGGNAAEV